ncbi:MAG TPA: hypothetical protein VFR24_27105 [Candidatus Angelobacter sp.]|nr:hypothetical protein [Candidatus Angelobacter sp.]
MARWIAFDQQTSSLLRSSLAQGTTVETFGRGPVDYALAKPNAVVTLLPSASDSNVGIAIFRWPRDRFAKVMAAARPQTGRPQIGRSQIGRPQSGKTRVTGFLGLSDEVLMEDEPQEKKSWWRRFWEE